MSVRHSKFNRLKRILRYGKETEELLIKQLQAVAGDIIQDHHWEDERGELAQVTWEKTGTAGDSRLIGDNFTRDQSGAITGVLRLPLTSEVVLRLRITASRTGGQGGSWSACIQDKEPVFDMLESDDRSKFFT